MEQSISTEQLFGKMSQRLAQAMHEFNHSNHPRQLYWNGYHHAIVELQEDVTRLIQEAQS